MGCIDIGIKELRLWQRFNSFNPSPISRSGLTLKNIDTQQKSSGIFIPKLLFLYLVFLNKLAEVPGFALGMAHGFPQKI